MPITKGFRQLVDVRQGAPVESYEAHRARRPAKKA